MRTHNFDLSGKTALITGGAGMLGMQHAAAILEINGSVVITDICKKNLDDAFSKLSDYFDPSRIHIFEMDVSIENSITTVLSTLSKKQIRIDILINNAAIDPKFDNNNGLFEASRLENFSIEDWNYQLRVGLTGAFLCSKHFGQAMANDGMGGVILNISSDLSIISPDNRLYVQDNLDKDSQPVKPISYSVIKSGLVGLTKYLATYWRDYHIRCNALSPGGVFTNQSEEFVNRISKLIPMGRMASVEEYKPAVQFLCSDASSYMNGQNLVIDGGRSIW